MDIFFLATAKIATFTMDIVWESCSKFNLEQLSHSMSVANIASLAVAKEAVFLGYGYNRQYFLQICHGKVVFR